MKIMCSYSVMTSTESDWRRANAIPNELYTPQGAPLLPLPRSLAERLHRSAEPTITCRPSG